ncbi:MAG: DEAD/DEAH box helicase [Anaerolineae bacterium]|nr:DEAD/DEAH box helicase [Anaerolineae bacterium]
MQPTYVALDLETTGLNPEQDQIIEIGVVRFHGDGEMETWSTLVNPGRPIPPRIEQLTGIKTEEVDRAPTLAMIHRTLARFVGDAILVGHNIAFDVSFLRQAGLLEQNASVDTFTLARIVLPRQRSYALSALTEALGITLVDAHRALADALATAKLFRALIHYAETHIPAEVIQRINRIAQRCRPRWPLSAVFLEVEQRQARHAFTRPAVSKSSPFPMGRYGGPGTLTPVPPGEALKVPLDAEELVRMLSPGGTIARAFPGYEHRPQQVEMLAAVTNAFNEGHHLLVEAGTGTGKSLAYLLPAIRLALDNQDRVVISTNTINLQDQLFNKDIPDLQKALGTQAHCALLKGRSNYLCLRRFDALCRSPDLTVAEMNIIAQALAWLPTTATGDQAELFLPSATDRAIWNSITSEPGSCHVERCSYAQQGRCFFYQARQRAQEAHIIVVNHALLLSDMATENRVLPEYTHLVIDEAHHLEETATRQLGFSVSAEDIVRLLGTLHSMGRRPGLLEEIIQNLRPAVDTQILEFIQARVQTLQSNIQLAHAMIGIFFDAVRDFLSEHTNQRLDGPYDVRILLDTGMRHQPAWSNLEITWDDTRQYFSRLAEQLSALANGLADLVDYGIDELDRLIDELLSAARHLVEYRDQLEAVITSPQDNGIYWAEVSVRSGQLSLKAAPLHVGPLIERYFWNAKRAVILTSATLRTARSFDYVRERLHAWEAEELAVGSPFDFKQQVLLYLPTDMPEPNQPDYQATVEQTIVELARATEGRLLALFTSYNQLRRTTEAVVQELVPEDFVIFSQGDGASRVQLLHGFRTTPKAVLLGTRSFWEGVDVVGDALSALVICRLPFAVPNDPIIQARSRTFTDPFNEYYLPDAILRFRQGFGRLIRSKQDTGICVILDRRVLSKPYGEMFLQSLPQCCEMRWPLARLPEVASRWLARGKRLTPLVSG